jgi:hypothetical protein
LRVEAALGEATVRFSTPNSRPMRELSIDAALGGVELVKLGNARAQHVFLTAALGGADVDLRGAWTGEMTLEAKVSLGGLGLSVPRDAGVMIRAASTLGGVDTKGFIRRADGAYYSLNYATAARKVTVDAKAVLGGVGFTWVEP